MVFRWDLSAGVAYGVRNCRGSRRAANLKPATLSNKDVGLINKVKAETCTTRTNKEEAHTRNHNPRHSPPTALTTHGTHQPRAAQQL